MSPVCQCVCVRVCVFCQTLDSQGDQVPSRSEVSNVEKLMHRACLQLNVNKMLSLLLSITRQMPAASYPFLLHSLSLCTSCLRHLDSCSKLRNWLARGKKNSAASHHGKRRRMSKQRQRITNPMFISLCWRCATLTEILILFSIFNFGV